MMFWWWHESKGKWADQKCSGKTVFGRKILPFCEKDLVVASDLACNIHIFKLDGPKCLNHPVHVIYNTHAKIISDLAFLTVPVPFTNDNSTHFTDFDYQTYVASCSYDGFLKLWTVKTSTAPTDQCHIDAHRPVFELFSSKKWLYGLSFDISNLCLYSNGEGKHFPQKILYLQHNRVIARKYNFFSENILQTVPGAEHIYSCGINGIVYRLSKQDVSRHLVKQKEKLKNKQVTKLFGF